jgi:hypothetical protein
LGFDLIHFAFQVAFLVRRRSIGEASRIAAGASLDRLGISESARAALGTLHLVELLLRAEEARGLGAGVNPRVYPAVLEVLAHRLDGGVSAGS